MSAKLSAPLTLSLLVALAGACNDHDPVGVPPVCDRSAPIDTTQYIDFLLVIDGSPTTTREQAALADGLRRLVLRLDESDVSYRIGIASADRGDPRSLSDAPSGGLILRSCRDRLGPDGDFVVDGVDASALCDDRCALTADALAIEPSFADDGETLPRPWIESIYGETNLPPATSLADALACLVPQGIAASAFASPLEGIFQALTSDEGRLFVRDNADLVVLVLSDGYDCSFNPDQVAAFASPSPLWSDPDAPAATPALCWNAGVECAGGGDDLSPCASVDRGVDGLPAASADDAVLHPRARYDALLAELLADKRAFRGDAQVIVAGLVGVPTGYPELEITYALATDPADLLEHVVAPGCVPVVDGAPLADEAARPPVRLRELADAFAPASGTSQLRSICDLDYEASLEALADAVVLPPIGACLGRCLVDQDPSTELLEPACTFSRSDGDGRREIPICDVIDGAWAPPAGASECIGLRNDPGGLTPETLDDMSIRSGRVLCDVGAVEALLVGDLESSTIDVACDEDPERACECAD